MKKAYLKKYSMITMACFVYAAGISLFIDPNDLAPGGFTGISIMISRLIPLETGTIYMLLNIPVIFLGIRKFGLRLTASTVYATAVVSGAVNFFSYFQPMTKDPLLAAVFGGILVGVGMGVVLRNSATTGGADIVVKYLRLKFPHLKTGTLMLLFDAAVISLSGAVFGNTEAVLYGIISAAGTSVVLDKVLYGRDGAKLIYIISDRPESITERLLGELDIGVTHLEGSGAYKNVEKKIIMCVVRKPSAHKVEEVVRQEDASAFMIISNASEIYGEGYKSYFGEVL